MNIGRIITIFLIIQILAGVVYSIAHYQAEKAEAYPYEPPNYGVPYGIILFWQFPVWLTLMIRADFISAIIIPLTITLFFIWVAYMIDKKIFVK